VGVGGGNVTLGRIVRVSRYTPPRYRTVVPASTTAAALLVASVGGAVVLFAVGLGYLYLERKRRSTDSVWRVLTKELVFDDPPETVGRGTFGLVLLAEYRGTQVAVKRVIPPRLMAAGSSEGVARGSSSTLTSMTRNTILGKGDMGDELAAGKGADLKASSRERRASYFDIEVAENISGAISSIDSGTARTRGSLYLDDNPDYTNTLESGMLLNKPGSGSFVGPATKNGGKKNRLDKKGGKKNRLGSILIHKRKYRDEYNKLKADFIIEMRCLSKLRHPCITTVMGAVIEKGEEPMLIMEYMDHGSLYDMLHNDTFPLDGDLLLPILRDIAQGLRFLHAAEPQVIHGDLKAQNVLVDSKFRAKVADFGLSAKKTIGATGTPYWMAPELLRGESSNSGASDVYSFGVILYEVYTRREPYQGEDPSTVLRDVADPSVNRRPPIPPACPAQIATIMTDCLDARIDARPTFEEIDLRLKRLDAENVHPGEMHLSAQARKNRKASRGEDLLFKVFPRHIAETLRDGGKVEPENRECVTVFFSDIVGFTDISASVSPMKVSDMLDRLYQGFDDLSLAHDVFKIETIGDAYLCVTNLVKDQESDHAKRIAEFSIDAIAMAGETLIDVDDPARGHVRIRVGFHSGPVIASVVGSRLPKYSMFGDTVNTASRMESNSLPGRIQCSDRTAELLKKQCPELPIVSRGQIRIKGKGEMLTFWVDEKEVGQGDRESSRTLHTISSGDV